MDTSPRAPVREIIFALSCVAFSPALLDAAPIFVSHFEAYRNSSTNGTDFVYDVDAADLNGDGRDDLVWLASAPCCVPVLPALLLVRLGTASGTLDPVPLSVAFGTSIVGDQAQATLRLARVNEDALLDAVVGSYDSLVVLFGQGGGTFAPAARLYVPGCEFSEVGVGDLDGDTLPDLVVALAAEDSIQVFFGAGSASFATGPRYPVGTRPFYVSVVDADGDAYPDVLVGDRSGSTLLRGNPGGGLTPIPVGGDYAFSAGDLDGDGSLDAISYDGALLGNGNGTFDAPIPHGMADPRLVSDLDEDGRPDLVGLRSGNPGNPTALVMRPGNGLGGFGDERAFICNQNGMGMVAADFDGDGHVDIGGGSAIRLQYVFRGKGTGWFDQGRSVLLPFAPSRITLGDLNGDGHPDLVPVFRGARAIGVSIAEGPASYPTVAVVPTPAGVSRVETGDLDGDGRADVIALCDSSATLSVWLADEDGTPGTRVDRALGASSTDFEVADLDGDDDLDVVVNGDLNDSRVFPGDGSGALGSPILLPLDLTGDVDAVELNGDANLDIVTETSSYGIRVILADGPLAYGFAQDYGGPGIFAQSLAVRRFDSDLHEDIILNSGTLSLLRGLGGGSFGPREPLDVPVAGVSNSVLEAADFDGDGYDDLAVPITNHVLIARSTGDGAFSPPERYGVSTAPRALAIADLDGNGRPDVVSVESFSPRATILLNQTVPPNVDVPRVARSPLVLSVRALRNPMHGDVGLVLDVPSRGRVTVDLFDLAGRRVADRTWESLEPGRHEVWMALLGARAAGLLFAHARQVDRMGTVRIVVLP